MHELKEWGLMMPVRGIYGYLDEPPIVCTWNEK
jgi:hypothetical protein